MSWTLVNSDAVTFADGATGHVYTLPSGAPSVGDLDVICLNSQVTVSTPSGWTLPVNGSIVSSQGAYVFYRIAVGGEGSTVTITTATSNNTTLSWSRWQTTTGLDVIGKASVNNVAGTTTPAVSTGVLAGTGELVIAFAALHHNSVSANSPTSPSWSAGYTPLTTASIGTGASACTAFLAYKTTAGTAAETPNVTWTNNCTEQYIFAVAFKPASAVISRSTADSATFTDSAARTAALVRSTADSATFSDSATRALTLPRSPSDSVTMADGVARTVTLVRGTSDAVTLTDSAVRSATFNRASADSATFTDVAVSTSLRDLILTVQGVIPKWQVGGPAVDTISAISLEYVRVPVIATVGGQPVNPTSDVVAMAFLSLDTATPVSGDWKTASWDTTPTVGGRYLAQCLIGPGGTLALAAGTWWVWVKITDAPEVPIRRAGFIVIT